MVSTQKSAASSPSPSPVAPSSPVADRPAVPSRRNAPPSRPEASEGMCAVHRLEQALRLTESLNLSGEQRSKIADLSSKQCEQSRALCEKEHELHRATHAQILALLTADQQTTLRASLPSVPEHPEDGEMDSAADAVAARASKHEASVARLAQITAAARK